MPPLWTLTCDDVSARSSRHLLPANGNFVVCRADQGNHVSSTLNPDELAVVTFRSATQPDVTVTGRVPLTARSRKATSVPAGPKRRPSAWDERRTPRTATRPSGSPPKRERCRSPSGRLSRLPRKIRTRWDSRRSSLRRAPAANLRRVTDNEESRGKWIIHGERVIDGTRRAVLSIAEVELPDGVRFEQYVLRIPRAATVLVLDDDERVLMLWRHRFILDRWVWELPGGYLDPDEEPAACAAREVEEETGWRPRNMELLLAFQPAVGTINQQNLVFLARGADPTGLPPDINETAKIGWIPLAEAYDRIVKGEIVGAGSVTGVMAALLAKAEGRLR